MRILYEKIFILTFAKCTLKTKWILKSMTTKTKKECATWKRNKTLHDGKRNPKEKHKIMRKTFFQFLYEKWKQRIREKILQKQYFVNRFNEHSKAYIAMTRSLNFKFNHCCSSSVRLRLGQVRLDRIRLSKHNLVMSKSNMADQPESSAHTLFMGDTQKVTKLQNQVHQEKIKIKFLKDWIREWIKKYSNQFFIVKKTLQSCVVPSMSS